MLKKKLFIFSLLLFLGSFLKLSFAMGSKTFAFSGINFIIPLFGAFFSLPISVGLLSVIFLFKQVALYGVLTLGLPTMVATLCWSFTDKKNKSLEFIVKVLLPILCILLFVLHPVGKDAFYYSFYWFIPIGLYIFDKIFSKFLVFSTALTSTFLAHAIGSIIWLYSLNMTSGQWLSLIPVVAVERLVFASGMTLSFILIKKLFKYLSTKKYYSYKKDFLALLFCK